MGGHIRASCARGAVPAAAVCSLRSRSWCSKSAKSGMASLISLSSLRIILRRRRWRRQAGRAREQNARRRRDQWHKRRTRRGAPRPQAMRKRWSGIIRLHVSGPTDLEICIMSARSAQRTCRRRWRMGRDTSRAGEREMRMRTHGRRVAASREALVIEGRQCRFLLLPPFALRRSFERRSASRPAVL